MDNAGIAHTLDEIADFLEILGENPFRVRAYRNAARLVHDLAEPITKLIAQGNNLQSLPGIGKDLAAKITTLAETGKLPLHAELSAKLPPGLRELLALPGMGPKKAASLHEQLKVSSLADLKTAAENHRIKELKGFGKKTEDAILTELTRLEATGEAKRFTLGEARRVISPLLLSLEQTKGVSRVEIAGSYRRGKETVGDVDILAIAPRCEAIMDKLAAYDPSAKVLARGETKMSVRLANGLQVDLRVVPKESYGAALVYFTGSKAHNIELRGRALERKLKVNEYGVFRGKKPVAGKTEKEVYASLGLPWIPPELREGRGEIQAAEKGELRELITVEELRGDLHMHTIETDGRATIEEMAAAARDRGYEYIAITDHSKRVVMARGMDAARAGRQWRRIDRLNAANLGITLLKGVELDILDDGTLDLPDDTLELADWVIASVHYGQKQSRAQITRRIIRAIKHPSVSAIAHPTGRLIGKRPPYDVDLDSVMKAAADYGCALEVNGQPDRLDLCDKYLETAKKYGVVVVIDSDAHSTAQLANVDLGILQARRGGLTADDVANAWPLSRLKRRLKHVLAA